MTIVSAVLWLAGLCPFALFFWARRGSALAHAIGWAIVAWTAWGWALVIADRQAGSLDVARYVALCLTGCAGIAVLGARRPQVFAWHFVVIGLLAVMLLPLLESGFFGAQAADPVRIMFLAGTLAVGLINYLPTRYGAAAIVLGAVLTKQTCDALERSFAFLPLDLADIVMLLMPWLALASWTSMRPRGSEFDRIWRDFRDAWGLFWAQRVREQFNRAASNSGWPVYLAWGGLHRTERGVAITPAEQEEMLRVLRAALGRFL
jgi:hypothetical protein